MLFTTPSPVPVAGRVVRISGRDTIAVAGQKVILHKVTVQAPGPLDSTVTDAHGGFHFMLRPDSGVVYLVSSRWSGIEYFATPFAVRADSALPPMIVTVSDTSSTAPFALTARHLIISPPNGDGTRDVVDLFVLRNEGAVTRVMADTLRPTWYGRISPFAINVHGGNSDFSLETLHLTGDTVGLFSSIPPGQREIEVDYQIPAHSAQFEIPVDVDIGLSNIVSADREMRVIGAYTRSDTVIDRKPYARWEGQMHAPKSVMLEFGAPPAPSWILPLLGGAMVLLLVGVTVKVALRPSGRPRTFG